MSSGLTAAFTTSISGTTVTFDGSTSSSQVASTITDYAWDFTSDGTYDTNGSSPTTSNDYGASGTYRVTLKITDNRSDQDRVAEASWSHRACSLLDTNAGITTVPAFSFVSHLPTRIECMSENPRIDELRRRVDKDPSSIAFAQLAEEHRRMGE